jgi:hypothetical protein
MPTERDESPHHGYSTPIENVNFCFCHREKRTIPLFPNVSMVLS